jgi:hypothetical protein
MNTRRRGSRVAVTSSFSIEVDGAADNLDASGEENAGEARSRSGFRLD